MAMRTLGWICLFFIFPLASTFPKTILLKNVSLYLPGGKVQSDAFLLIDGAKIARIGTMAEWKPEVVDEEFDLKGYWVYPAWIDPYYPGFQDKPRTSEPPTPAARREQAVDKNIRKPFAERGYYFDRQLVDQVRLTRLEMNKLVAGGVAVVQVVPEAGIVGGETAVLSLVSENTRQAVLVASAMLHLAFEPNRGSYPSIPAAILAELRQLKADSLFHRDSGRLLDARSQSRPEYAPELEFLLPYFQGEKRFLVRTRNLGEQRLAEFFCREVAARPVLVLGADCWRRPVVAGLELILPLDFKPPAESIYAGQGDKQKKDAETILYPKNIAAFVQEHPRLSLTAPEKGDYKALLANARRLKKEGVPEAQLLSMLTENPARLLGIARWAGTLAPSMLANIIVSDGPLFAEKSAIKKVWVEGQLTDVGAAQKTGESLAVNLTGRWTVKFQSPMGNMDMAMSLVQEGGVLTGKLSSQMGTMEIQEGLVSGKTVTFSVTTTMMGRQVQMSFSGTAEEKRIEGRMSMGSRGEATVIAVPDENGGER